MVRSSIPDVLETLDIDGPYPSIWMLDDRPGVWIVVGTDEAGRRAVIDLGWSSSARSGLFDHPALLRWRAAGCASAYAACYTEDPQLLDRIRAVIRSAGRASPGAVG